MKKIKPIAVFITDIHFTLKTLELAKVAFIRAQFKAKLLDVPLVVGGDTLDSKAIMRAEIVNTLIELVSVKDAPPTIFLVGNHEKINEKGTPHSLHFLKPYTTVIENVQLGSLKGTEVLMVPYQDDPANFTDILTDEDYRYAKIVFAHQGLTNSNSGEYILDRTAVQADELPNKKYIVGHYHQKQEIKLKQGGVWTFAGNPYSLTFGEANDGDKGYHILYDDGSLEFIPTNLRRHVVYNWTVQKATGRGIMERPEPNDLVWVKVTGGKEELSKVNKKYIASTLRIENFKLDLIPTETEEYKVPQKQLTNTELLDSIIDNSQTSDEGKARIKNLWRGMA